MLVAKSRFDLGGNQVSIELGRPEFESVIRPKVEDAVGCVGRLLMECGSQGRSPEFILLAGGTSRIPLFGELLGKATGLECRQWSSGRESIALGAAIHAFRVFGAVAEVPRKTSVAPGVAAPDGRAAAMAQYQRTLEGPWTDWAILDGKRAFLATKKGDLGLSDMEARALEIKVLGFPLEDVVRTDAKGGAANEDPNFADQVSNDPLDNVAEDAKAAELDSQEFAQTKDNGLGVRRSRSGVELPNDASDSADLAAPSLASPPRRSVQVHVVATPVATSVCELVSTPFSPASDSDFATGTQEPASGMDTPASDKTHLIATPTVAPKISAKKGRILAFCAVFLGLLVGVWTILDSINSQHQRALLLAEQRRQKANEERARADVQARELEEARQQELANTEARAREERSRAEILARELQAATEARAMAEEQARNAERSRVEQQAKAEEAERIANALKESTKTPQAPVAPTPTPEPPKVDQEAADVAVRSALAVMSNGTLDEAKEAVRLLGEAEQKFPENREFADLKAAIMEVFRAEAVYRKAQKDLPEARRKANDKIHSARIAGTPSRLTGRVADPGAPARLVNEANAIFNNAQQAVQSGRDRMVKALAAVKSATGGRRGQAIEKLWEAIARRNSL